MGIPLFGAKVPYFFPINDLFQGIPDPPDGVGPFPKAFLHWPHHVDDFGLLKWIISTFLA